MVCWAPVMRNPDSSPVEGASGRLPVGGGEIAVGQSDDVVPLGSGTFPLL